METIEQIFFRKINPSDFRNMYSVAVPSSGGGQTYIEAAGISDDTLIAFLDYAEMIAPTSKQETRMAFRFNCYKVDDAEQYDFIEFQPRRGRNYRIVRQTEAHRHPAWREGNGFPVPLKDENGSYVDDAYFTGIIDNLLIVIIRTSYRKYYAWFVNEPTIPTDWPKDVGLESMFVGDRRGILVFEDAILEFTPNLHCPFASSGKGKGVLALPEQMCECRQLITYGAPGTGKSDGIERKMRENHIEPIRTTFHPDSDYQSFVGAYKPFMKKIQRVVYVNDGKTAQLVTGPDELKDEEVISYEFRPQSFTEAYVKAWEAMVAGEAKPVVLVIEEINRGDCAKIFGDLFQLLDRDDKTGFSRYPIVADHDLRDYLEKTFGTSAFQACASVEGIDAGVWSDVKVGKKLVLPPNLYIWATMNTSDQSLFPMDSAFKRRWDWKYVPIKNHKDEGWTIDVSGSKKYDWWDFLQKVNKHIFDLTNSEDKQLGYFFVKAKNKVVSLDVFVNKVVFYLWNAVFKDCYTECDFLKDGSSYLIFTKFFDDEGNAKADVVQKFLDALKVDPPKAKENGENPVEAD